MSELQTLAEMTMLDASKCVFTPTEGGYLSLKYEDKEYERVKICRALPYKAPDEYICIIDKDGSEIGILRDIKLLSEAGCEPRATSSADSSAFVQKGFSS